MSGNWQLAIGLCVRSLQTAFPGMLPVDGCDVLAYSCAAARELHPLPCLRHKAKTRKPKDVSKSGKIGGERNLLGGAGEVNWRAGLVLSQFSFRMANQPPSNEPIRALGVETAIFQMHSCLRPNPGGFGRYYQ